jgi:hypothetical protein
VAETQGDVEKTSHYPRVRGGSIETKLDGRSRLVSIISIFVKIKIEATPS